MTIVSAMYKNLKPIGGTWTSVKTGLLNEKYLAKGIETACGKQGRSAVIKTTVLPQNHPLKKAGISEIGMQKRAGESKIIQLFDDFGEIVSLGITGSKEGLSDLKKDIQLMLQGKLKFTKNEIIRK